MLRTSISDTLSYRNTVSDINKSHEIFKEFKRNPIYKEILEHVDFVTGQKYFDLIKFKYKDILKYIDKFKTNDSIGNAITFKYDNINISPNTLRYIKVLAELIEIFGNLNNLDIIEIGCGYGGQCKIIHDLFSPKSYTIVDLPEVLELNKKYLSFFNIKNTEYKFIDDDFKKYDLVISNYAFTECDRSIQKVYLDKILKNSKSGYITCNIISNFFNIDSFSKDELLNMIDNVQLIEEEPLTHKNNFILIWKK